MDRRLATAQPQQRPAGGLDRAAGPRPDLLLRDPLHRLMASREAHRPSRPSWSTSRSPRGRRCSSPSASPAILVGIFAGLGLDRRRRRPRRCWRCASGSRTSAATSAACRATSSRRRRRSRRRRCAAPAASRRLRLTPDSGGDIPEVAPSDVHTRTMSRIESTPTSSPPSTTTRWRMWRRDISIAARSRLQSGAAEITVSLMWAPTSSASGSSPRPIELSTSRSETTRGPGCSSSMTTAAPTPFSVICRAASRSVWPGPRVRITLDMPSRTSISADRPPYPNRAATTREGQRRGNIGFRPWLALEGSGGKVEAGRDGRRPRGRA